MIKDEWKKFGTRGKSKYYVKINVHPSFYEKMIFAKNEYSKNLGKNLSMTDVSKMWGEGNFRVPKLRKKKWII